MRARTRLPAIPDIAGVEDSVRVVLEPIKEIVEVQSGRRGRDHLETSVTWRDLVALGLITEQDIPKK